ncbi:MAG: conjugal transfer protein TraR [Spongiibacter sp.]|mgnify:CR=1 FL=1|uniref:hypothetical protein n=1 Tax=Spongiibacter sp. TaxID=2024860 RepID=UPI000C09876E|nr:hypothetical protein [Spongiibacter sp.]MAK43183.1 conjugal transfer protein TraR [Spongiibacter sp.]
MATQEELYDQSIELQERERDAALERIRKSVADMPKGAPGECAECGEYKIRLVNDLCGRCRDKLERPRHGR